MTLTTINLAALGQTINLGTEVTGTLPTGNGGTGSTATTFVNAASNVTGTLPTSNGGTGATSFAPGKVGQIQHITKNTLQTFSSSTYADSITDTITCSASSSSVMVMLSLSLTKGSNTTTGAVRINEIVGGSVTDTRNITDIWGWDQTTFGGQIGYNWMSTPSSTAEVTYTVQLASQQNLAHIQTNNYQAAANRAVSTLILMEILA